MESIIVPGDVSKRADVEKMVQDTVAKFGRLDIAVSNAGIEVKKAFVDVTDDEYNKVINVNQYGAFLLSQIAARRMIAQKGPGKLINISSVHEDIPFPGFTPYCVEQGGRADADAEPRDRAGAAQDQRQQHRARRHRHADQSIGAG